MFEHIKELTHYNNHSEALVEGFKELEKRGSWCSDYLRKAENIMWSVQNLGYLSQENSQKQYDLHQELDRLAKEVMSEAEFKEFHRSF